MASGNEALVARLDRLERELGEVGRRLASLEERVPGTSAEPFGVAAAMTAPVAEERPHERDAAGFGWLSGSVALTGRTLLVLAGAFLLRAITDGGYLPAAAGVAIGLLYAAFWLLAGDRAGQQGQRLSANFHGFAAAAVAYPLIWETTTRMGQLSTEASAVLLATSFTVGLALAWRSDLVLLAWVTTLFALATAVVLLFTTRALTTYGLVLLLLASWTEVLAVYDRWPWLRVLPTLGVSSIVLFSAYILASAQGLPPVYPPLSVPVAVSTAVLLPTVYVAGFLARAAWRRSEVTLFQSLPAFLAVGSGLGAGAWMFTAQKTTPALMAVLALLLSAACYAATWKSTSQSNLSTQSRHALAGLGLLLALAGTALLVNGSALALLWSVVAVLLGGLGLRYPSSTLNLHGTAFLLGATWASGLVLSAWDAFAAGATGYWRPVAPAAYLVAVAAALGYLLLLNAGVRARDPRTHRLCALLAAVIVGWSLLGLILGGLAGVVGAPGPRADASALATIRTGVLASLTVALSWVGSRWGRYELTWLAYSLLAVGAAKLVLEDFRVGQPATLFFSLGLYGGALILTSRLAKQPVRKPEEAVS